MAKEPAKEPKAEPKTTEGTIPPPGEQGSGIPTYEPSPEKDEGGEPETAAEKAGKKTPSDRPEDEDTESS
jgi:hypothetical protein